MLKKSIHGFFNHDLDEVNSSRSHKNSTFQVSQFGNPSMDCTRRVFFNTLLTPEG